VLANDDRFILDGTTMLLPVLDNDEGEALQVTVLEVPAGVTVAVEGDQLRVTVEAAGMHVLSYRITNGSSASTATVTVVNLGSEVLVDELAFVEAAGSRLSSDDVSESEDAPVWERLAPAIVPPGLRALTDLELPLLGFSFVGAPAVLGMIAFWLVSRRRRYVRVDGVARSDSLDANGSGSDFELRHDAAALWSNGRRRRGLVQVQTPNGNRWVPVVKVDVEAQLR